MACAISILWFYMSKRTYLFCTFHSLFVRGTNFFTSLRITDSVGKLPARSFDFDTWVFKWFLHASHWIMLNKKKILKITVIRLGWNENCWLWYRESNVVKKKNLKIKRSHKLSVLPSFYDTKSMDTRSVHDTVTWRICTRLRDLVECAQLHGSKKCKSRFIRQKMHGKSSFRVLCKCIFLG